MRKAKYYAYRGMDKVEIEADSVGIITDDGVDVDLHFRKSEGEISLSVNGRMIIIPYATSVIRIQRSND